MHTRGAERFDFLVGVGTAEQGERTGMPHTPFRRRVPPGDEGHNGFRGFYRFQIVGRADATS